MLHHHHHHHHFGLKKKAPTSPHHCTALHYSNLVTNLVNNFLIPIRPRRHIARKHHPELDRPPTITSSTTTTTTFNNYISFSSSSSSSSQT
jgi:hypothetical protein